MPEHILNKLKSKVNILFRYGLLLVAILLVVSLVRNVFRIVSANERIREARNKTQELKALNESLKEDAEVLNSELFVEKQARDKLGLAKEGEIVLVLPEDEIIKKLAPASKRNEEVLPDPTWKKWLRLFL